MLISTRLEGKKVGADVFAFGSLLLGFASMLQLLDGPAGCRHGCRQPSLTLFAPAAYALGGCKFFNRWPGCHERCEVGPDSFRRLENLGMGTDFQTVFYISMPFQVMVLPPTVVWLVVHRLTGGFQVMAVHDPLTGLLNRRGLMGALESHFRAYPAVTAHLLIVDIAHFKRISDTYGHEVGDLVLSEVAEVLQRTARQGDLVCRLGREEFVRFAFDTNGAGAKRVAERVR